MNNLDEKYSTAGSTNIYNDGSININIHSSRSREKSKQDEISNYRRCKVDHNNNTKTKRKVDNNTNNIGRANLKTKEGCNKSKCNKIGNEVDNRVFRNFGMENEYLTSDKNQITDEVTNINEDEISYDNGLTRNNNLDKAVVILPLTIKDDLLPSNKLETVDIIDNNVVTKVIIAPSNHTPTQKSKKVTA